MAEFSEVIRQKKRMCTSILCSECDICRLCGGGEDSFKCWGFIHSNPKKAEEVIMAWAADHPKLVYPTWGEWLNEQAVVTKVIDNGALFYEPNAKMQQPVPIDIAEKLGIKQREE